MWMGRIALGPAHGLDIPATVLVQELVRSDPKDRVIQHHPPACPPNREAGWLRPVPTRVDQSLGKEDETESRDPETACHDRQQPLVEPPHQQDHDKPGDQRD